jgi:hypothetical protein
MANHAVHDLVHTESGPKRGRHQTLLVTAGSASPPSHPTFYRAADWCMTGEDVTASAATQNRHLRIRRIPKETLRPESEQRESSSRAVDDDKPHKG